MDVSAGRPHSLMEAVTLLKQLSPQLAARVESFEGLEPRHLEVLQTLVSSHKSLSQAGVHAVQQQELQAAEYEREVQRLNDQLSTVGVVPTALPAKLQDDLTALAGIANELDLVVVSENSMAAAWGCLSVEDMKASRLQMMLSHKQAELDRLLSKARSSCEQLAGSMQAAQQRLSRADRQLSQQALQYWPDMPAKLKKYRDQEFKHRAELNASGFAPQIKHSQLVASHQQLEGIQRELQEKQAAIEIFQNLPPSQENARLQLRQMQETLVALTGRLHSDLGLQG